MSCSIHIKSYIAIPPLNFGFHSCVAMDVVTLGILLAGHPDAGNVCGYATVSYCNVSVCDSATQKRLRASSLLRTFLYSVCGSATNFLPAYPRKNVHWPTAAFQHVRLVLLRCPPWCSRFRLVLLHSPPWYSRARAPPLLLLPLPPTLSGFRPRLLLLTTWCSRARLSDTDTLSLSPSPTLTHTHAHSVTLHSHSYTVVKRNLWLAILRRWCYSPYFRSPATHPFTTRAYDIHIYTPHCLGSLSGIIIFKRYTFSRFMMFVLSFLYMFLPFYVSYRCFYGFEKFSLDSEAIGFLTSQWMGS